MACFIRIVALPVGAVRAILDLGQRARFRAMMSDIVLVFPVPGPPLIIKKGRRQLKITAKLWDAKSVLGILELEYILAKFFLILAKRLASLLPLSKYA